MFNARKGFLLVDLLMAITIITVALMAIGLSVIGSSRASQVNDIQTKAYKTAQARMEGLKSVSTANWKVLSPASSTTWTTATNISNIVAGNSNTSLTAIFLTNTTPTVASGLTLTTYARQSSINTGRLVEVRVLVVWAAPAGQSQGGQVELVSLFERDP